MMWEENWASFVDAMEKRLTTGFHEYGDKSFSGNPTKLVGEMMQECEDIMGWGYILWCRLRRLQNIVEVLDEGDALH